MHPSKLAHGATAPCDQPLSGVDDPGAEEVEEDEAQDSGKAETGEEQQRRRSLAKEVVRAIHAKWRAQAQRALDYRRLLSLLAFIALLLGVLYSQRGAATAFRVHSTISGVVGLGGSPALQSADSVYDWLGGVLGAVWKDPICGDGLCESPFEFASYGRFGCRADCGALIDLQALAALDVDLYYNFGHQTGSLPAAELMSQAAWNLCPQATAYDSDCYFQEDQGFDAVAGTLHAPLPDIPDGTWSLVVKRDLMAKVGGAVRSTDGVARAGIWTKVYAAAAAAAAEQAYELGLLQQALAALRTPFLDFLPALWAAAGQAGHDLFDASQMRNATCACGANATAVLTGTAGFADEATYQTGPNCTGLTSLSQRTWYANGTSSVATSSPASLPMCTEAMANLTAHLATYNSTILVWLVNQRLGNLVTTGKYAARASMLASIQAALAGQYPELVAPVFTRPSGNDALNAPADATVASLAALFVDAPSFQGAGPPAHLALFRRRLNQDPGVTFAVWAGRVGVRIAEISAQQAEVAALSVAANGTSFTVGTVATTFAAAGANATWMPAPNATALGALGTSYNYATWPGGRYEFISCSLARRAPEYVGSCQAMPVTCGASAIDGIPYACVSLADNATVNGNLSSSAYRQACELPCDLSLDCAALCDCGNDGCAAGQVCTCPACVALQGDAVTDGEFKTIAAAAASSGAAAAVFAPISASSSKRRRLMDTTNDQVVAQLAAVASKVDALRSAQDTISAQVAALQGRLDTANLMAEARAASTKVQDLITAGRADIASGQKSLEGKLDTLLRRQQAVLDAANTASATLGAIQGMAERQASALADLDAAVKDTVKTISVATQQGLISLATALSYWKVTRRNRATEAKVYHLANSPCNPTATTDNPFVVDNGNAPPNSTARDRSVGLSNRIVGGILLHTWRVGEATCAATRFSAIQAWAGAPECMGTQALEKQLRSTCSGAPDVSSYGIDPAFKPGTVSFQPDLVAADDGPMLAVYDCNALGGAAPTYSVREPGTGLTVNAVPYCAELFNARNVPYGFHHFPLPGAPPGFPVWLDINLSEGGATTWLQWLRDALLLDAATRGLIARFVTYNAELGVFASATSRIQALRMELYDPASTTDTVRYAAEIALSISVGLLIAGQLWDIGVASMRRGGLRKYLSSPAKWMDAASNLLLGACCFIWWEFASSHAKAWSMALRYDVYTDLQPTAKFLNLANGGQGLAAAWAAIRGLEAAVELVSWYYALTGISILLLLARLLRRMDFQPRLGIITRSLRLALPDLLHFFLVAGAVFVGYSMTAFLIFGNSVPQFAGFGTAVNSCFQMMLGDFTDVFNELDQLTGVQGVAGSLFFWSYMLLVFLVLLNFLLAIIVDAFSEIKDQTKESTGIHSELARLAADQWRSLASWLPGGPTRAGRRKLDALLATLGGDEGPATGGDDGGGDGAPAVPREGSKSPRPEAEACGRTLHVCGQDLGEDDLAAALAEAMAPFDAAAGAPGLPRGREGVAEAATADEVAAVARFVMRRYGRRMPKDGEGHADASEGGAGSAGSPLKAERDRLATALEQLAEVQRELAEAQRQLMAGQRQLAEQQARLIGARK